MLPLMSRRFKSLPGSRLDGTTAASSVRMRRISLPLRGSKAAGVWFLVIRGKRLGAAVFAVADATRHNGIAVDALLFLVGAAAFMSGDALDDERGAA